jgi:hypothetical protein
VKDDCEWTEEDVEGHDYGLFLVRLRKTTMKPRPAEYKAGILTTQFKIRSVRLQVQNINIVCLTEKMGYWHDEGNYNEMKTKQKCEILEEEQKNT